jgi:hypothetical protein
MNKTIIYHAPLLANHVAHRLEKNGKLQGSSRLSGKLRSQAGMYEEKIAIT